MKKDNVFLIDTNLLVYAYGEENSERKKKSFELLKKCFKKEIFLAVSNQNLAEFSFVLLKKLKLDASLVKSIISDISHFENFKKVTYNQETIFSAIEISEKYKMSFWDSLIASSMIENGIRNIYTENSKDFKVPFLNVVNPLK